MAKQAADRPTNLVLGFTADERSALTAQLVDVRPDLTDDPDAQTAALQALATIGLYAQLDAAVAVVEDREVAAALEVVNQRKQLRIAEQAAVRRPVDDPLTPSGEEPTP